MAKRFPVLYPMPFNEDQYKKYLELAVEPVELSEYIDKAWGGILPEKPRVCRKHKKEGVKTPLEKCSECMRYHKDHTAKTVDNLVRCGFLKRIRGHICQKHSRRRGGKEPRPVEGCRECKPYRGKLCNFHRLMALEYPDLHCSHCVKGYVSITVYPIGEKWIKGELKGGFGQLVGQSVKIAWGYQMRLPNAIDASRDILGEFGGLKSDETLSGSYLFNQLAFEQQEDEVSGPRGKKKTHKKKGGYDFNYAGEGSRRSLREMLTLLVAMGALKKVGRNKYSRGSKLDSRRDAFTKADMVIQVQKIIKDYGPKAQILDDRDKDIRLKTLLSKYYIYVQSGGIGKDQWFLREIYMLLFTPIPKDSTIECSTGRRILLSRHKIEKERKSHREKLAKRWSLSEEDLYTLNIGALRSLVDARSEDDVQFLVDSYSTKFNRSILDRLVHDNGIVNFPLCFKFYSWQKEAVNQWISGEGVEKHDPFHGIVSVVTGAGKTVMALLAVKSYIGRFPDARISVIVPTKVLMYQWARELSKLLAIPSSQIGFRGDGFKDSFDDKQNEKRIMVLIINSAIRDDFLKDDVSRLDRKIHHLLIADECHRYTGEVFKRVFECRRDSALGLSATPIEREDLPGNGNDADADLEQPLILEELGSIFYELNYRQALEQGLISEFTVNYVGVDLISQERSSYDACTKKLAKVLEKIRLIYGNRLDLMKGTSLDQKLQVILKTDEKPDRAIGQYFKLVRDRRKIVNDAVNRKGAYYHILNEAIENDRKTIVFHERIEQLNEIVAPLEHRKYPQSGRGRTERTEYERSVDRKLEELLQNPSYRPVMYHSGHEKDLWNRWAMDWFGGDTSNTMLSVKALIEGVDVPAADVGIVRVSSSSVRQRIQATGRILRKADRKEHSDMYVIFVKKTVDENIFKKYNWKRELGSSDIKLFYWLPDNEDPTMGTLEKKRRDLLPVIEEYVDDKPPIEVDTIHLKPEDPYPGRFVGDVFHVTSEGRPYKRSKFGRIFITNSELVKAGQLVKTLKGGGKLLVNPQGNMITRIKGSGTIFLGTTDLGEIRKEIEKKRKSYNTSRKRKRTMKSVPTFEELFGSTE
ncbi:MAG: DEAD/DEAH box helicase [Methanomassiliicoccales archaeon]|nr:MAG: DEAD/DEAH box helicase [Methanomassiliicoccales archaeon]